MPRPNDKYYWKALNKIFSREHTIAVVVTAIANINSIMDTGIGDDVRRSVVIFGGGITTAGLVEEVVCVAVPFAVPLRAKHQDRITTLIEWVEVPTLRVC